MWRLLSSSNPEGAEFIEQWHNWSLGGDHTVLALQFCGVLVNQIIDILFSSIPPQFDTCFPKPSAYPFLHWYIWRPPSSFTWTLTSKMFPDAISKIPIVVSTLRELNDALMLDCDCCYAERGSVLHWWVMCTSCLLPALTLTLKHYKGEGCRLMCACQSTD